MNGQQRAEIKTQRESLATFFFFKKRHSADLMKAKTHTYGPSFIYTHIPIYVSKELFLPYLFRPTMDPFIW